MPSRFGWHRKTRSFSIPTPVGPAVALSNLDRVGTVITLSVTLVDILFRKLIKYLTRSTPTRVLGLLSGLAHPRFDSYRADKIKSPNITILGSFIFLSAR